MPTAIKTTKKKKKKKKKKTASSFPVTKSESKCSELMFLHVNSQNRFYTEYQCLCEPLSKLSDDLRVAAS